MASDYNQIPPAPGTYGASGGSDQPNQPQGTERISYAQAQQGPASQGPTPGGTAGAGSGKGDGGRGKAGARGVVGGAVAGGVVSAALVCALLGTGVIGGAQKSATTSTTASSNNGTITINTNDENATTAEAVASKCLPSVVTITVTSSEGTGLGSGVILDDDGNIITNYHVVDGAQSISVTIDGRSYTGTLVGSDASSDIAVVHAEVDDGTTLTPMEVGDSSSLVVGEWVMTIGSPLGLEQSVSTGIVSALYRSTLTQSASGNTIYTNLIQTDAAINQGNSGGALVNAQGQLVGINTLLASETQSFSGIGLAIPGNYAVDIAEKIIAGEPVTHAYMGVSVQTVNATNAQANNLGANEGAYVAAVTDGGSAASAGIQVGDIITKVDDTDVASADGLILAVRSHSVGDTVTVTYVRGNETKTAQVTLGSDEGATTGSGSSSVSGGNGSESIPYDLYDYYRRYYGGSQSR